MEVARLAGDQMNPLRRSYCKYLMRVAAKKHSTGDFSDAWYGATITKLMFRLAGHELKAGDSISPVDFELAVPKALRLPTAYQWNAPELERRYGPYSQAPTFLKNATGDYVWDTQKATLAKSAVDVVRPLARFEVWAKSVKEKYPTLTGGGMRLFWIVVAAIAGVLVTLLFTSKK